MAREKLHDSPAARVAAHRAKHGKVAFSVDLSVEVVDQLKEYLQFKGLTRSACIEKLIVSQLLRKR